VPSVTPLPAAPQHFLGIMNLRGQVISVIDLRLKLKTKQEEGPRDENAVILLDLGNTSSLGVLVDSVNSVLTFEGDQISPCPQMDNGLPASFLSGVARAESSMLLMLDLEKVFSAEDKQIAEKNRDSKIGQTAAA
jgi:purine-binding chemotaxis protein CheW